MSARRKPRRPLSVRDEAIAARVAELVLERLAMAGAAAPPVASPPKWDSRVAALAARVVCDICRRSELVTGEIIATFYGWHLDDDRATCPSCDEARAVR